MNPKSKEPSPNTLRTAWSIAARHFCRGQRNPVEMIAEAIEEERARCIALIRAAGLSCSDITPFLENPDAKW